MITKEQLKDLLHYNHETGIFTRAKAVRCHSEIKIGDAAGCVRIDGYITIRLDGARYLAHRLAWLYVHGAMPVEIDHINRDRSDNRIENLLNVTHATNMKNKSRYKNNSSGVSGVHFYKGLWIARIGINGCRKHIGSFKEKAKAVAAVIDARACFGYSGDHGLR